jgi:hypothetical protein
MPSIPDLAHEILTVNETAGSLVPLPVCLENGNADMYGLGIRLGFYVQWYTLIVCNLLKIVEEIPSVRLALSSFVAANFIALAIQTARHALTLLDIYIALILYFGVYLSTIPVFLWRLATNFNPAVDPTRWHVVRISKFDNILNTVLIFGAAVFQLYFWIETVPKTDFGLCVPSAFFFTRMGLDDDRLRTINIAAQVLAGFICIFSTVVRYFESDSSPLRISNRRLRALTIAHACILLLVATFVVAGTELTIRWNHIDSVHDLGTSGQLIPLVVGISTPLRIVLVSFGWGTDDASVLSWVTKTTDRSGSRAGGTSSMIRDLFRTKPREPRSRARTGPRPRCLSSGSLDSY